MSESSSKNTKSYLYFKKALEKRLASFTESRTSIAKAWGIAQSTLETALNKYASIVTMEKIAENLGIDLPELLLEGRALLAGAANTGGEIVTTDEESPDYGSSVKSGLEDIKELLKAISDATLGQIETSKGQIEAIKQADSDIIKEIKQNKIEEYENKLAYLKQELEEKKKQIRDLETERVRVKTRMENKLLRLVPDDNGGDGERVA